MSCLFLVLAEREMREGKGLAWLPWEKQKSQVEEQTLW